MTAPVQVNSFTSGAAQVASITVSLGVNASPGNTIIIVANSDATLTVPGGSGYTLDNSKVASNAGYLWRKTAGSSDNGSVVITPSVSDTVVAIIAEYPGTFTLDKTASASRAGSSSASQATGTTAATAQAVEQIIVMVGAHSFAAASPPTGPTWATATNRSSAVTSLASPSSRNCFVALGDYATIATGAQTDTCTWTNVTADAVGIIATYTVRTPVSTPVTATDSTTFSDSATLGSLVLPRSVTDSVVMSDVAARSVIAYTRTATDAITITDVAAPTINVKPVTKTGSWWQLDSVIRMAAEYKTYYDMQEPVACPNCGQQLLPGPPQMHGAVLLFCPWGHFQYPRDWDKDTMSGM